MIEMNNFIQDLIKENNLEVNKKIHTRFPPEPNGYLHIGHAKAICINFEIAKKFGGVCNLRMDDTNPTKENFEYVENIKKDVKWLGYDWEDRFYYASDYFEKMFEIACDLIKKNLAYVCGLSSEEMKKNRGNLTDPAVSPFRDRSINENLDLFNRMKNGEFSDGSMTLRAKINLNSGNFNLRDPVLYRIDRSYHYRTGNKWCIYPMYDYAHPIEDILENITHSLCSLEFENHRPLYDWVVNNINLESKPKQIEFARLNLEYTVMSKRKLKLLVDNNLVSGWDDPRMPTISGLRNRGYTPEAIRNFCEKIGVSKSVSTVEYSFLEHCLREDLNLKAQRVMAVLNPVKLVITNYPEDKVEKLEIKNNPNNILDGKRKISFSKELYIEKDDFSESPSKKFYRLFENNLVRLKSAYVIKCVGFKKDNNNDLREIYAEYLPETKSGSESSNIKVKSTIHWVDSKTAITREIRLYNNLFLSAVPENFLGNINKNSLEILKNCKLEKCLANAKYGKSYQFMRTGYFCLDSKNNYVFNKAVSLKQKF
ncbi:MAG: glutamine--tRNA ligase/YqeY domain fusion protein [Candidatus Paraimprobicoccus trichonymphae]|uniref:Glutamine--tRNA ligase n=1 Tax=Candidatus Paraimprobicoccus trichonymphae TaxID=3033793 RepID=A0AA48L1I0_9FIRM|nr:MAG: glutamine--tRNA ligase/YqeY domain fusion protein [Candidatus Paraimprobicoccus trichonymphae]